ncbi:hypothetical protein AgCh_002148 [Apium graveolens]
MISRGRGRLLQRPSLSTHIEHPECGEVHLDAKNDKSQIHNYGSGGSATTKFSILRPGMVLLKNFISHRDQESLNRGLPIVSISVGDSAEFFYGDQMDVDKVEKIVLESGDVLIFGGKSRHVYHGLASILTRTAPQALLQESDLLPGRLNLTFRQY